ncbi:hypothetical protein [Saccharothrix xinjiangensis]|uniref:Uncharacterized protein n=1 Tax=Saccharothrix xinjiangensis TaxID=204798 RepID=A0ABV9Y894_9PSEU
MSSPTTEKDRARLVVPYIAMWSEETSEDPRLVELPHGAGIAYADEILADRDSRGAPWLIPDRTRHWPGWPEGMPVAKPPIRQPCAHLATPASKLVRQLQRRAPAKA